MKVHETFDVHVTNKTVSKALTRIGFTFKLLRVLPVARNSPEIITSRHSYADRFLREAPINRANVVWVDECGFNLHLRRKHGRARRGLHGSIVVPNSRGQNISVCAAMNQDGFLIHQVRVGAFTAALFCDFLEHLFTELRIRGREQCWIIMDNVRFHHAQAVTDCAMRFGHTIQYLPAYSPMLNPIESLFGKWKTSIRTSGVIFSRDALLYQMEIARREISVVDCLGWIYEMNINVGLCLQDHVFD
jgi:transposase